MRIVSLVPSLSHMLCDMGLQASVVGCTKFCVAPPDLHRTATLVGGTKDPDMAAIAALAPTHILVNEEENKPEHVHACRALAPTLLTFPKGPADVAPMLADVEDFLGRPGLTAPWRARIADERAWFAARPGKAGSFLYLIWREPYMAAGPDTYISRMLELAGLANAYQGGERYPALDVAAMRALRPDHVFLATEPYPFRKRDAARLRAEWPEAPRLMRIDGQLMSWYGSMTVEALAALRRWREGEAQGLLAPLEG